MKRLVAPLLIGLCAGLASSCETAGYQCTEEEGLELFEKRIEPVISDDRPHSCNQCHLSGIDLSNFVQDSPCQTMACLEEQGLVDLDDPKNSTILGWIERAEPDSELITEAVIAEEYDGFLSWIEFNAECDGVCPDFDNPCGAAGTYEDCAVPGESDEPRPTDDPGDCSDLTIEQLFADKIYAWRGRCFNCHYTDNDGPPEDAPRWIVTGECDEGSLATMRNVEQLGLIDVENPTQSKLLLKPLSEEFGGVWHGGHHKFVDTEDVAYLDFLYWLERYAECNG